jgi:hypothetical protein
MLIPQYPEMFYICSSYAHSVGHSQDQKHQVPYWSQQVIHEISGLDVAKTLEEIQS